MLWSIIFTMAFAEFVAIGKQGVNPDLLGDHAKAVISALSGFFHDSKQTVQRILKNIFYLPISLDLVSTTQSFYEDLCKKMEDSPYLHIDEIGHKCRGESGWGGGLQVER